MTLEKDQIYLNQALELAKQSVVDGGGPFGAIIVKNDQVIGRGNNRVTLSNDPTAHAEIIAIREACNANKHFDLSHCTIYASCEPCPMCFSAIHWARIDRIVYSATGDDAAKAGFDDTIIAQQVCLDYADRSINIEHITCEHSLDSFKLWQKKSDKITY